MPQTLSLQLSIVFCTAELLQAADWQDKSDSLQTERIITAQQRHDRGEQSKSF